MLVDSEQPIDLPRLQNGDVGTTRALIGVQQVDCWNRWRRQPPPLVMASRSRIRSSVRRSLASTTSLDCPVDCSMNARRLRWEILTR